MKKNVFLRVLCFFAVLLILLIAASSTFAGGWLIFKKPPYKGKVIDSETKEPIEGAVVVAVYKKTSIGLVESYTNDINVREALTDKNGEFYIPSYITLIQPLSWGSFSTFIIYKPGYGSFPQSRTYPPMGIPSDVLEEYFMGETGKEGELVDVDRTFKESFIINRWEVTFGIVELPRARTWLERIESHRGARINGEIPDSKIPKLRQIVKEEDNYLKPMYIYDREKLNIPIGEFPK